ncbi:hypothetical protein ACOSQ3_026456 [Xanthoceras sorbifolium]
MDRSRSYEERPDLGQQKDRSEPEPVAQRLPRKNTIAAHRGDRWEGITGMELPPFHCITTSLYTTGIDIFTNLRLQRRNFVGSIFRFEDVGCVGCAMLSKILLWLLLSGSEFI